MTDPDADAGQIQDAAIETSIMTRAIRFARTYKFVNHRILNCADAQDEIIARFGTPGSTQYREIRMHMDWSPEKFSLIQSENSSERADLELLLAAGVELLVVCSQSDIIYHEWVGWDFD